jgi:hypothetical protein
MNTVRRSRNHTEATKAALVEGSPLRISDLLFQAADSDPFAEREIMRTQCHSWRASGVVAQRLIGSIEPHLRK